MTRMVGREAELDALIRALERARDGRGSVALVGGEAGIGKTTLLRELQAAAAARDVVTLWGRTPEAVWAGPYAPWIDALDGFDGRSAALFTVNEDLAPEDRQIRIHDRVLKELSATVARKPALLVLEDLHWAQPATLDLLRHVAFSLHRAPLLISASYRLSAAAPHLPLGKMLGHMRHEAEVHELDLTGLDRNHLAQILGPALADRVDEILAETKGNPLFAVELARTLAGAASSARTLDREDTTSQRVIPLSVRQAIGQRLDQLSDTAQHVLLTGAIFAEGFDVPTVAALTERPEADVIAALDEAMVAGFIEPGSGLDEFAFAHAIVRHAILANWQPSLLIRERRHAADLLAAQPRAYRPGEIAALYHASRSLPGAEAGVDFALDAAEDARRDAAHEQTAEFLRIARDLLEPDDPRREEILRGLAIAEAESLQIEEAVETGWQAIDAMTAAGFSPDEIADFSAAIAVALKHRAGAAPEQWNPFVTAGLQCVEEERGLGWARLSFVQEPVEPVSRSGVRAGIWTGYDPEAIAIARAKGTEEDQARSYESFDRRTREETDALLTLARGFRNPYARLHALTVAGNDLQYSHGAFRDAVRVWNEVASLSEKTGAIAWQAQALNQRALLEIALGDLARADVTERDANALLVRLGPGRRPELFAREMATARTFYLGGPFQELADFWIAFADDPALGPGETISLLGPFFAAVGAFAAAEASSRAQAQATLDQLVPILEKIPLNASNQNGAVAFAAMATWNLRDQRHAPALRRLLGRMLEAGIQDYPQTSVALGLALVSALLDRADETETAFVTAQRQLETSGQAPLRTIAEYEQAAWLSERTRPDFERAAALADAAFAEFDRLGMPFWRDRATNLRQTIEQKAGPATYPAGLTEREVEVLSLAVQGHSDKEISDLLFISPRTVNAHMRNMFAKTGSANRTELSVWAVAQGLFVR
jgi:DNA-binding CsgD family transcriptional regulator